MLSVIVLMNQWIPVVKVIHISKALDFIEIIFNLKKRVKNAMRSAGVDMSSIEIDHMEGYPEVVEHPEPMIINYYF